MRHDGDTLYILTGPTAVGKTSLALEWAKAHEAEILNCDSLLFYQGMDVGTAKPSAKELSEVRHHGIDIVPCRQPYSISDYIDYARCVVSDLFSRKKRILITGGSGFYLKSFLSPVVDEVGVTPAVKKQAAEMVGKSLDTAVEFLRQCNPDGLPRIDLQNPRRVATALERCIASGKSLFQLQEDFKALPVPYSEWEKRVVVLNRDRDELNTRIELRVRQMLQTGLIDEVRSLLEQGLEENPSAAHAIGYREVIAYLRNGGEKEDLIEEICRNTRYLAKKQRTWFRHQLPGTTTIELTEGKVIGANDLF